MAGDCARCTELEQRYKDPETANHVATLYVWASHMLRDHDAQPSPRSGCEECAKYAKEVRGIHPYVWERWAQQHYMSCRLASANPDRG